MSASTLTIEQKALLGDVIEYILNNEEEENFRTFVAENPDESYKDHVYYKAMVLAEEVLGEQHILKPGTKVEVGDPYDDNDMWEQAFDGTVKVVKEPFKLYTIEDQDGNCFDVDMWKIY